MNGKIDKTVTVSPFVVIPGDDLVEIVVQGDAGLGIDDGRTLVMGEIGGNKGGIAISQNSLHGTFRGLLQGSQQIVLAAWLFGTDSQVDQRNIRGWDL